jgi:hypothetical protein
MGFDMCSMDEQPMWSSPREATEHESSTNDTTLTSCELPAIPALAMPPSGAPFIGQYDDDAPASSHEPAWHPPMALPPDPDPDWHPPMALSPDPVWQLPLALPPDPDWHPPMALPEPAAPRTPAPPEPSSPQGYDESVGEGSMPLDLNTMPGLNGRVSEHGPYIHSEFGTGPRSPLVLQGGLVNDATIEGHNPDGSPIVSEISVLNGTAAVGDTWTSEDGTVTHGLAVHGNILEVTDHYPEGAPHERRGLEIGSVDLNANYTDDTATLGISATGVELSGDADVGANPNRNDDDSVRGALGIGEGFGVRAHYGDRDHDGVRELGFGCDVGPGTIDVRSEHLGQAFNAAWNWGSHLIDADD